MTSIQDRLNWHDWDPSIGDQLIGKITEISEHETKYGPYPVLVVRDDNGEGHNVHCLRGGLFYPVIRHRPSVGEGIGIRYDGQVGNAHRYSVVWETDTKTAPDWDRIETAQRDRADSKPAETSGGQLVWPVEPPEDGPEPPPDW